MRVSSRASARSWRGSSERQHQRTPRARSSLTWISAGEWPGAEELAMTTVTNDRVRKAYRRAAPRYDKVMRLCSRIFDIEGGRAWACGDLTGRALELGIGTGLNLTHYPPDT